MSVVLRRLFKRVCPVVPIPFLFIQDPSFTGADVKRAIIAAINASPDTDLVASDRGDNTLFVSGATVISPEIDSLLPAWRGRFSWELA